MAYQGSEDVIQVRDGAVLHLTFHSPRTKNALTLSMYATLADALETGQRFEIQIAGERISVPVRATFNIEHERSEDEEEIEFQIKWSAK